MLSIILFYYCNCIVLHCIVLYYIILLYIIIYLNFNIHFNINFNRYVIFYHILISFICYVSAIFKLQLTQRKLQLTPM